MAGGLHVYNNHDRASELTLVDCSVRDNRVGRSHEYDDVVRGKHVPDIWGKARGLQAVHGRGAVNAQFETPGGLARVRLIRTPLVDYIGAAEVRERDDEAEGEGEDE